MFSAISVLSKQFLGYFFTRTCCRNFIPHKSVNTTETACTSARKRCQQRVLCWRSLRATLRGFLKSLLSTAKRPLRTAQREGSIFTYCRLQNLPTFAFRCGSLRLCLCFLPAAAATSRRTFSTSLHCVFGGFPADFRQNFGVFGEIFGSRFGCRLCAVRH